MNVPKMFTYSVAAPLFSVCQ